MPACHVISDDLIFSSRITATARAHAIRSTVGKSGLVPIPTDVACVLVDLANPGLRITELIAALPTPRPYVVAYGSHVDTASLKAARSAGCDLVLPRSRFVELLESDLPTWLAHGSSVSARTSSET